MSVKKKISIPVIKIMNQQENLNKRQFIGNSFSIRNIFVEQYEFYKEILPLEKLKEPYKTQLKQDSIIYTDGSFYNRMDFCKAVVFFDYVNDVDIF